MYHSLYFQYSRCEQIFKGKYTRSSASCHPGTVCPALRDAYATLSLIMAQTTNQVRTALQNVIDPELGISIVDLGLIYEVSFPTETTVKILMTLTSMGCPLFGTIQNDIVKGLEMLGYVAEQVEIELTFDPPWNQEKMSETAKAELGID